MTTPVMPQLIYFKPITLLLLFFVVLFLANNPFGVNPQSVDDDVSHAAGGARRENSVAKETRERVDRYYRQ